MILSVCVNPALDVSASVDRVETERKLRTDIPIYEPGGGGVNVAKVARSLGAETNLVVALGGHTGSRVADLIAAEENACDVVTLATETRQSVTIASRASGRQYRFVFPGARLTHEEEQRFHHTVVAAADGANVVVLSGSLPPGVDVGLYRSIIEDLPDTPVIVDTSGPAFVQAARSHPALLKPSVNELSGVVGRTLANEADYLDAVREVLAGGKADAIAVSLGPAGALLVRRNGEIYRVRPPAVRPVSAVGAGDSMVAAIAVELANSGDLVAAIGAGVGAGTAAVLTPGSQLCRPQDAAKLADQVIVEPVG